jgi:hypothetical protein
LAGDKAEAMTLTWKEPLARSSSSEIGINFSEERGGTGFAGGIMTSSKSYKSDVQ